MSLPTKEQFEELKKKRKQEMERKRILERQVRAAWGRWRLASSLWLPCALGP